MQIQRFKRATTQLGCVLNSVMYAKMMHVLLVSRDAYTTCQRWRVLVLKFDRLLAIRPVIGHSTGYWPLRYHPPNRIPVLIS